MECAHICVFSGTNSLNVKRQKTQLLLFLCCMLGADGFLLVVDYGDSGGWNPQHGAAVQKLLFTLSSLIVVVSCIKCRGHIRCQIRYNKMSGSCIITTFDSFKLGVYGVWRSCLMYLCHLLGRFNGTSSTRQVVFSLNASQWLLSGRRLKAGSKIKISN